MIVDESGGGLDIRSVEHSDWEGVRGVGQDTGDRYLVSAVSSNVLERKDPGANEYTIVATLRIIGRGGVEDFEFIARAHATLNANDDLVLRFFDVKSACRG